MKRRCWFRSATTPGAGLAIEYCALGGIRTTENDGDTIGPGGTIPDIPGEAKEGKNAKPPAKPKEQSPPFGFSGSLGKVENDTPSQLLDINGDGLPDKIEQVGD